MSELTRATADSDALSWIERNVPGGVVLVAAALADLLPEECPALVDIIRNEEAYWDVPGRFVKYFDPSGGSLVMPLRSQYRALRTKLGEAGYRDMIRTMEARIPNTDWVVHCFTRETAGALTEDVDQLLAEEAAEAREFDPRCMNRQGGSGAEIWCDPKQDRHSIYCPKNPSPRLCQKHSRPVGGCRVCSAAARE